MENKVFRPNQEAQPSREGIDSVAWLKNNFGLSMSEMDLDTQIILHDFVVGGASFAIQNLISKVQDDQRVFDNGSDSLEG